MLAGRQEKLEVPSEVFPLLGAWPPCGSALGEKNWEVVLGPGLWLGPATL